MKFRIKETKFIRKDKIVTYYIKECVEDLNLSTRVMKSLENVDKITTETIFNPFDSFEYGDNIYEVLENDLGLFITRTDNLKYVYDNTKEKLGIKNIFSNKDKTIMICDDDSKYMTTKYPSDKDDLEKAVMLLLLKREGYRYKDIVDLVQEIGRL